MNDTETLTTCRCGKATLTSIGAPIVRAACYCTSCQTASEHLGRLPGAAPLAESDGSTRFVLVRKDRVEVRSGEDTLRAYRLKPGADTRRVVASCCNSAMFLEFNKGHWLSIYQAQCSDQAPSEMRTMTRDKRADVELPKDIPSYATHSGKFMWRLLKAWFAMRLRVPATAEYPPLEVPASRPSNPK